MTAPCAGFVWFRPLRNHRYWHRPERMYVAVIMGKLKRGTLTEIQEASQRDSCYSEDTHITVIHDGTRCADCGERL